MVETQNADDRQNNSIALPALTACLADLPPVSLKGLALMEHPSLLADHEVVRVAVIELIAYTIGHKLSICLESQGVFSGIWRSKKVS